MQLDPCLPALEKLMKKCWEQHPVNRPSAAEVLRNMKQICMLCDHRVIISKDDIVMPLITCLDAPKQVSYQKKTYFQLNSCHQVNLRNCIYPMGE